MRNSNTATRSPFATKCLLLLALALCFLLWPTIAHADDILVYEEDAEIVTAPRRALARAAARAASPTGVWTTFQTSTSSTSKQVSDYYISPKANSDGSVEVTVRTSVTRTSSSGYSYFTTTKTLFDNGNECAYIGPDTKSIAYPGQTISQQVSFSVRGGGTHHITSTETDFRSGTGVHAGWDFTVEIPFTITATANTGGTISPSGYVLVTPNGSQSFTVEAEDGYRILDVVVDGNSQGAKDSYTFDGVSANHTITANFKKIWTVTFIDGITGETIDTKPVDEGDDASAPTSPEHDGWQFSGWDGDYSNVGSDTTVTATYTAIIKVRVPTLLECQILADGSILTPSDYAIENLSVVDVVATSTTTADIPSDASYTLLNGDEIVHSYSEGDQDFFPLYIGAKDSRNLTLQISDVSGAGEWRDLANRASNGVAQTFCSISYVFSQAS